jgi:two-component system, OmpR family, sensor histidine kinase VicK
LSARNSNIEEEKTEILYDYDVILRSNLELGRITKSSVDNCITSDAVAFLLADRRIADALTNMKNKGVKLRYITEITKNSLDYCKELMKMVELRHLDEVKGNFGIHDGRYYRAAAAVIEGKPPPHLIVSNVKIFVEQQQYFFDMLWRKAIPAKQRIKEIEEGTKREFIETIQDPSETLDLIRKIISSATEEIMIMFPTTRSFQVYEKKGILNLLKSQLENKGDEANKPLLNQVNYALLNLQLAGKHDAKPSHEELRDWLHTGQVDVVRMK